MRIEKHLIAKHRSFEESRLPDGTAYTRVLVAMARAGVGGLPQAAEIAKGLWGASSLPAQFLAVAAGQGTTDTSSWPHMQQKAAVAAGSTSDATWAGPISPAAIIESDFLHAADTLSAIGRLTMLRRVPPNTLVARQTARIDADWVVEGGPIPAAAPSTDDVTLEVLKLGGIVTISAQLVRSSDSRSEQLINRDLQNAAAKLVDSSFFDPNQTGTPGASPASITAGLGAMTSTGTVETDIELLIDAYSGSLESAAFVTDRTTATQIGLRTSGSNSIMVGARGGEIVGVPVFVSDGSPRSTSGGQIVLFDQATTILADDGIEVDTSSRAAIQLNDAPSAGAQPLISLWQSGLLAFRLVRRVNWEAPPAGSAVLITSASY